MMTRKHYVAVAKALNAIEFNHIEQIPFLRHTVVDALCDVFQEDNPLFDADRFIYAATGGERHEGDVLIQMERKA